MSANDKLAATFHGADPAQVRIDDLALDRAARLDPARADYLDSQREQALRDHVTDLLTDVDHFGQCGPTGCGCLVGRLQWAISAEQVTS